jgi:hypothetical protein
MKPLPRSILAEVVEKLRRLGELESRDAGIE